MGFFYDAQKEEIPKNINTQICIVGAGATGLTLATYFANQKQKKVLLIESGGEQVDSQTMALNEMLMTGIPLSNPPNTSRMRFLGGSTNCWGGWSRLISEDVVTNWPISFKELSDQTPDVNKIFCLHDGNFDQPSAWYRFKDQYQVDWGEDFEVGIRQIRAERLWGTHKTKLKESQNVEILYNANAYNIHFKDDNETIDSLECKSLNDHNYIVKADTFILACGGLENPLLLLNFDRLHNGLLKRKTSTIGLYYSDHHEPSINYYPLSCFLPVFKNFHEDQKMYHWVRMFFALNKKKFPEIKIPIALSMQFHPQCLHRTQWDFENLYDRISIEDSNFDIPKKKKSEVILQEEKADILYAPTPSASNNISLSEKILPTGHYQGKLTYNLLQEDLQQLRLAIKIYEQIFRKNNLARLKIGAFNLKFYANPKVYPNGRHHMGGTRMGLTSKTGVVDKDLKMFGTSNLYIVGPGVFPSFDWMGPTYTAAALSIRLARHLMKNS